MLVKHFELHFMYKKYYTNKLLLLLLNIYIYIYIYIFIFIFLFFLSIKLKSEDTEWHDDTSVIIFKCNTCCNYWSYYLKFP